MAHLIQPMQVTLSKGVNNNDVIYFERARWNYSCLARDRHELNSMGELNFQCKTWITSGGSRNLYTGGAAPAWYNFYGSVFDNTAKNSLIFGDTMSYAFETS